MSAATLKLIGTLAVLALLVAGCQPIQPVQPEGAVAPAAPPAEEAAAGPALVQRDFPLAGLSVGLPEEWVAAIEPLRPAVLSWSASPFDGLEMPALPPSRLRNADKLFWSYLSEKPVVEVTFFNVPTPDAASSDMAGLLQHRFGEIVASERVINPRDVTTVVEPATSLTINGQPAVRMVLAGEDLALGVPMHIYAWAIANGDRMMYVNSALTAENEAAFAPLVEQIVSTVSVSAPQPEAQPAPRLTGEIAPGAAMTGTLAAEPGAVVRDFWRFSGKEGMRYVATLTPLAPHLDLVAQIVDASGAPLTSEMNDGSRDVGEVISFEPGADGDYYLIVRSWYQGPGEYKLELAELK